MSELICSACQVVNSADSNFCSNCQAHLKQASVVAGLEARIVQLEQTVAQLSQQPAPVLAPTVGDSAETPSHTTSPTPQTHPQTVSEPTDWRDVTERWLGRIGVVLVIFAAIFLFRYAIDQGWLTETRRVALGLLGGVILTAAGLWLRTKRGALGRALLGGGIATFYVTSYAAFELYDLISLPIATACFITITVLTILLSLWQDEGSLALLAAFGGFATPVLLSSGSSSAVQLVLYTIILVLGLSIVFWRKGWVLLQRMLFVGGWFYTISAIDLVEYDSVMTHPSRLAMVAAAIVMALAGWLVPLIRQLRTQRSSATLPPLSLEIGHRYLPDRLRSLVVRYSLFAVFATPFLIAFCIGFIYERFMDNEFTLIGVFFMATALVYLLIASRLRALIGNHASTAMHVITAALLIAPAIAIFTEDEVWVFIAFAASVAFLAAASRWVNHRLLWGTIHLLSAFLVLWTIGRMADYDSAERWQKTASIFGIAAIATAAIFHTHKSVKIVYWIAAHLLVLVWLANLFNAQQGFVSIAWGVYAVLLLVVGLVRNWPNVQLAALATIALIVIKLFLVDLSDVEAIWRVLLFLGVGISLLVLSFFYRKLARDSAA